VVSCAGDVRGKASVHRTRHSLAEFGAFIELEPGIEGWPMLHVAPTGTRRDGRAIGHDRIHAAFEILSIDLEKKRIGVALVEEGSARATGARRRNRASCLARVSRQVDRHEKFGVFVFLGPGPRTGSCR